MPTSRPGLCDAPCAVTTRLRSNVVAPQFAAQDPLYLTAMPAGCAMPCMIVGSLGDPSGL